MAECRGVTKKGQPCKGFAHPVSGVCAAHEPAHVREHWRRESQRFKAEHGDEIRQKEERFTTQAAGIQKTLSTRARTVLLSMGLDRAGRSEVRDSLPLLPRQKNCGVKTFNEIQTWVNMDTQHDKLDEIIATWERGQREGWDIETRLALFGQALKELQRMRDHLHERLNAKPNR